MEKELDFFVELKIYSKIFKYYVIINQYLKKWITKIDQL